MYARIIRGKSCSRQIDANQLVKAVYRLRRSRVSAGRQRRKWHGCRTPAILLFALAALCNVLPLAFLCGTSYFLISDVLVELITCFFFYCRIVLFLSLI